MFAKQIEVYSLISLKIMNLLLQKVGFYFFIYKI